MKPSEIRKLARREPFAPFVMILHSGDRIRVSHPEAVWPAPQFVGVIDRNGDGILVDYRSISAVRIARRNGRRNGGR